MSGACPASPSQPPGGGVRPPSPRGPAAKRRRPRSGGGDVADGEAAEKCRMRRAGGGHHEQRSGVVTVERAEARPPFRPSAPRPLPPARDEALLALLRPLAERILTSTSSDSISELIDCASKKFIVSSSHSCWYSECELVVTVLYMAISFPRNFSLLPVAGIVLEFFERWFQDAEGLDFKELVKILKKEWKCTALSTLFLLYANLFPDKCDVSVLKYSLTWKNGWYGDETPPSWLLNATVCTDISDFNSLLLVSAIMLKGDRIHVDCKDSYVGSAIKFLCAVDLYKNGYYEGSIKHLLSISHHECGTDMQGWIFWLLGVIYKRLGKFHIALQKLKTAVGKSKMCIPAVFNIFQIYSQLYRERDEYETLSLFTLSEEENNIHSPVNIQSSILALHHNIPNDLPCRALYLLASRCLRTEIFAEAVMNFILLLEKLENLHQMPTCSKTLLMPEDDIPKLPAFECLLVLAAIAHMCHNESESALKLVAQFGDEDLSHSSFYESTCEQRILCITAAVGKLIRVKALAKLGKVTEALQDCVRLEHETSWVSSTINTEWDETLLLFRTYLYKTLSYLHNLKNNKQNCLHYKRLQTQCLKLLRDENFPTWESLCLSKRLAMDNIYFYMKERVLLK